MKRYGLLLYGSVGGALFAAALLGGCALKGPAGFAQPSWRRAFSGPDLIARRRAVRAASERGQVGLPVLERALRDRDPGTRRTAALCLADQGTAAVPLLQTALADTDPYVRQAAVQALNLLRPKSPAVYRLIDSLPNDPSPVVGQAVEAARRDYLLVLQETRLPHDGWKFRLDPEGVGEQETWFRADLDDAAWDDMFIEKAWQHFGYKYIGKAWYRRTVVLPQSPDAGKTRIEFSGVDESAWVWINGSYVGCHDIGPKGWDTPFHLDISGVVKWAQPNQITVRAMNTACAGGIWRPVTIRTLAIPQ